MGVYCFADDISLLSPPFTGIKEMFKICEDVVDDHDKSLTMTKVYYLN